MTWGSVMTLVWLAEFSVLKSIVLIYYWSIGSAVTLFYCFLYR